MWIQDSVVSENLESGVHVQGVLWLCIENNLVYGQVRRRGVILACPGGGGGNHFVNNTVVEDEPLTVWNFVVAKLIDIDIARHFSRLIPIGTQPTHS